MKRFNFLVVLTTIIMLNCTVAQNITWQSVGLESDSVIDFCKTKNNIMFAVTQVGIFKISTNNGISWETKTLDTDIIYNRRHIEVDTSNNFYYAQYGGVYKSTNLGTNWTKISNGFIGYPIPEIYAIKILPNQNIVAGTLAGTEVSTNGGESWTIIPYSGAKNSFVLCNNVLFASGVGLSGMGIKKSTDYGLSWSGASYFDDVWGMEEVNSKLIVLGNLPQHFSITTNFGVTWDSIYYSDCPHWATLRKDMNNNLWAYFYYDNNSIKNGLYYSKNEGNTWQETEFPYTINSLYVDKSNFLFLGTAHGLFKIDASILPVELTSFTAFIKSGLPNLEWKTSTEINNSGFEIQKSINQENWEKIGFVKGSGTTSNPQGYSFVDTKSNISEIIYYRLNQVDFDGTSKFSPVIKLEINRNLSYGLSQNYPNPFNPSTTIGYSIPTDSRVSLKIYDVLGKEVMTLVNEQKSAGAYTLNVNLANFNSGVYFYTIKAGNFTQTKKLLMVK